MKNLLYILAISLWAIVLIQALQIQHADAVKFEAYSQLDSEAQQILDELAAGKDQSQALSKDSLQLALTILDSLQAQEIVLDDINISR